MADENDCPEGEWCHICRPPRYPWEWDGPYGQMRWSGHLAKYPDFMIVKCTVPGCDVEAAVPLHMSAATPATPPARYFAYAVHELLDEGWRCDTMMGSSKYRDVRCPKH